MSSLLNRANWRETMEGRAVKCLIKVCEINSGARGRHKMNISIPNKAD